MKFGKTRLPLFYTFLVMAVGSSCTKSARMNKRLGQGAMTLSEEKIGSSQFPLVSLRDRGAAFFVATICKNSNKNTCSEKLLKNEKDQKVSFPINGFSPGSYQLSVRSCRLQNSLIDCTHELGKTALNLDQEDSKLQAMHSWERESQSALDFLGLGISANTTEFLDMLKNCQNFTHNEKTRTLLDQVKSFNFIDISKGISTAYFSPTLSQNGVPNNTEEFSLANKHPNRVSIINFSSVGSPRSIFADGSWKVDKVALAKKIFGKNKFGHMALLLETWDEASRQYKTANYLTWPRQGIKEDLIGEYKYRNREIIKLPPIDNEQLKHFQTWLKTTEFDVSPLDRANELGGLRLKKKTDIRLLLGSTVQEVVDLTKKSNNSKILKKSIAKRAKFQEIELLFKEFYPNEQEHLKSKLKNLGFRSFSHLPEIRSQNIKNLKLHEQQWYKDLEIYKNHKIEADKNIAKTQKLFAEYLDLELESNALKKPLSNEELIDFTGNKHIAFEKIRKALLLPDNEALDMEKRVYNYASHWEMEDPARIFKEYHGYDPQLDPDRFIKHLDQSGQFGSSLLKRMTKENAPELLDSQKAKNKAFSQIVSFWGVQPESNEKINTVNRLLSQSSDLDGNSFSAVWQEIHGYNPEQEFDRFLSHRRASKPDFTEEWLKFFQDLTGGSIEDDGQAFIQKLRVLGYDEFADRVTLPPGQTLLKFDRPTKDVLLEAKTVNRANYVFEWKQFFKDNYAASLENIETFQGSGSGSLSSRHSNFVKKLENIFDFQDIDKFEDFFEKILKDELQTLETVNKKSELIKIDLTEFEEEFKSWYQQKNLESKGFAKHFSHLLDKQGDQLKLEQFRKPFLKHLYWDNIKPEMTMYWKQYSHILPSQERLKGFFFEWYLQEKEVLNQIDKNGDLRKTGAKSLYEEALSKIYRNTESFGKKYKDISCNCADVVGKSLDEIYGTNRYFVRRTDIITAPGNIVSRAKAYNKKIQTQKFKPRGTSSYRSTSAWIIAASIIGATLGAGSALVYERSPAFHLNKNLKCTEENKNQLEWKILYDLQQIKKIGIMNQFLKKLYNME